MSHIGSGTRIAVAWSLAMVLSVGQAGCQQPVDRASIDAGATITGPRNASGSADRPSCAIDGEIADVGPSHGYSWAWLDTPTVVTFAEPAIIDTVEIVLSETYGQAYSYRLSVSADGEDWQVVADLSDTPARGLQMHQFEPVEARHVRLEFTDTTLHVRSYHIVEIAAWHLGEEVAVGPLGRRFAEVRHRRTVEAVSLLGVQPAQEALSRDELQQRVRALDDGEKFPYRLADGTRALIARDGHNTVIVIDDDTDMADDATGADWDSDCLAVDTDGDGLLERTIDYDDLEGDGVADRMVQTYTERHTWGRGPFMVLIRDLDQGPVSLWALHDYGYIQGLCQWECDFAGDGYFVMFRRSRGGDRWIAALEAPFCFYDPDGDGLPEETVRITATDTRLHSLRYGVNADNDTTEGQLYDYDLSVTCLGSPELPAEAAETFTHRSGDSAGPFLAWETGRETARGLDWERALLVWDENDHNVAARKSDRERWEGIINARYRDFPQVGGPPTMRQNKRFELDRDFSGRMRLYFWPADGRLHLHGAEVGTLQADYDYDGQPELVIEYADTDEDGYFDQRTFSYPGTDLPDRRMEGPTSYGLPGDDSTTYPCAWEAIGGFWPEELGRWIDDCADLLEALEEAAEALGVEAFTGPTDFYQGATERDFEYIERLRASRESRRYYQDLAVELGLAHLAADAAEEEVPVA
ncbi:MAG: discoidin domain-containing protein, partial [Armatimonadota bacterium]